MLICNHPSLGPLIRACRKSLVFFHAPFNARRALRPLPLLLPYVPTLPNPMSVRRMLPPHPLAPMQMLM